MSKVIQFCFPLVLWTWPNPTWRKRDQLIPGQKQKNQKAFLIALATGVISLAVGLSIYTFVLKAQLQNSLVKSEIQTKLSAFGVSSPIQYLFLALFISVIHSFLEEYYWRGFIFSELRKRFTQTAAVLLSSVAFTLHHIIIIERYSRIEPKFLYIALGSSAVLICGIIWAIQYSFSKKLWVSWISHVTADWVVLWIGFDLVFLSP
jgi:membrane protease YdiL (CAAX protease family)